MPPTPESFEGQTTAPAATDVFTNRNPNGPIDPTPAPGNGSLPPGAVETPDYNKRTPSVTKVAFLKKVGE